MNTLQKGIQKKAEEMRGLFVALDKAGDDHERRNIQSKIYFVRRQQKALIDQQHLEFCKKYNIDPDC